MFTKEVSSTFTNPFGAQDEVAKHRVEAAKTFTHPMCVGTTTGGTPTDDGVMIHSITSVWQENPNPPEPQPTDEAE